MYEQWIICLVYYRQRKKEKAKGKRRRRMKKEIFILQVASNVQCWPQCDMFAKRTFCNQYRLLHCQLEGEIYIHIHPSFYIHWKCFSVSLFYFWSAPNICFEDDALQSVNSNEMQKKTNQRKFLHSLKSNKIKKNEKRKEMSIDNHFDYNHTKKQTEWQKGFHFFFQ